MKSVGVVGLGAMGSGIAQVVASAGFEVIARDVTQEAIDRGRERIAASLARRVTSGKMTADRAASAQNRIRNTLSLADLAACDLVIEAVVERRDVKQAVFRELDQLCGPATIFASNTSSLTIVEMAAATQRPDRFAGMHFFNPPVMMSLVEIVRGLTTSDATVEALKDFVKQIGQTGIVCADTTGFIVNRLLVPYLNAAVHMLEQGVAAAEEIDQAVRLGLHHPMGPFELLDYAGLDINYEASRVLFEEFKDPNLAPPSLIRRMVLAGRLGVKTGRGFYEYDEKGKRKQP